MLHFWLHQSQGTPDTGDARAAYRSQQIDSIEKIGAGERIRTVDPNLGKVMLYP
jgi:hypothetical protein